MKHLYLRPGGPLVERVEDAEAAALRQFGRPEG
jgi:hypothetical protein